MESKHLATQNTLWTQQYTQAVFYLSWEMRLATQAVSCFQNVCERKYLQPDKFKMENWSNYRSLTDMKWVVMIVLVSLTHKIRHTEIISRLFHYKCETLKLELSMLFMNVLKNISWSTNLPIYSVNATTTISSNENNMYSVTVEDKMSTYWLAYIDQGPPTSVNVNISTFDESCFAIVVIDIVIFRFLW